MIRVLLPLLIALGWGIVVWRFSVWKTAKDLDQKSVELVDPALRPVMERMARALDLPRVRVYLYDVPQVNGLAAPDGRIFITRGFHREFRAGRVSAEELASVIAHELGHVALGHGRRRQITFAVENALRAGLALTIGRFIPRFGGMIAGFLTSLVTSRLSRGAEFEADAYATALLAKAGIGAEPQKSLFAKLEKLTGTAGTPAGAMPAWMMSHPKTSERIKAIEANQRKWGIEG
ncbi:M48 family metallopeptidase [Pseudoroseicyclus tamaricis]|uniref:M48 family metallopeptidase n=1 Tax=Pseudoroseicyclus tamaricis TaxID=2705421 RepID=A0A6B2K1G6_9RHOB|nr:M48 family metallopeptidase [Pseudoroseicyclus tamaricis]NDV01572.1 M48 family metallopeptidase [Pseudoroseicyclus tamaricis]